MRKIVDTAELKHRVYVDGEPYQQSKIKKDELCCWVCEAKATPDAIGWEIERDRDYCPRHRRAGPKAMTTLGEMLTAKKEAR